MLILEHVFLECKTLGLPLSVCTGKKHYLSEIRYGHGSLNVVLASTASV